MLEMQKWLYMSRPGLPCMPRYLSPWTALLEEEEEEEEMFPWAAALQRYHPALEGEEGRGRTYSSSLLISSRGVGVSI